MTLGCGRQNLMFNIMT